MSRPSHPPQVRSADAVEEAKEFARKRLRDNQSSAVATPAELSVACPTELDAIKTEVALMKGMFMQFLENAKRKDRQIEEMKELYTSLLNQKNTPAPAVKVSTLGALFKNNVVVIAYNGNTEYL